MYISDRAYTRDQILNMEKIMLNALRFNLTVPSEWGAFWRVACRPWHVCKMEQRRRLAASRGTDADCVHPASPSPCLATGIYNFLGR